MKKVNKKIVIGFVGLPGSGKSTALEGITQFGPIVTMGDIVRNEVKSRGQEINSITLGNMAKELRDKFGPDIIAKKCIDLIKSKEDPIIFVDGIRSMHEVELFRQHWEFPIIAIICEDSTRHARLIERGRSDDSMNQELIKERDIREMGFGVGHVIESAEYRVENKFDKEDLKQQVNKIIQKIISREN